MNILVIDDERSLVNVLKPFLEDLGYTVERALTGTEGMEKIPLFKPDIILLDISLPDISGLELLPKIKLDYPYISVVVITGNMDVKIAVEAMKKGAEDYLAKPLNLDELQFLLNRVSEKQELKREVEHLKHSQREQYRKGYLFLSDPAMKKVYEQVDQVAQQSNVTVLILGETGTGKEHVAKLIHVFSPRSSKPFVELHCGAMPEALLESELFGYEPGAFTDAKKQKQGLFEVAQGGSIFLDEVGELPVSTQIKLLKVLEQKSIRRLGGLKEIPINVRIIAATNRDLGKEVKAGNFRADLYYRINVALISLPPLHARPNDIRELAQFFFADSSRYLNKKLEPLSEELLEKFMGYSWPGNVRELRNVMERMVLYSRGNTLEIRDLPSEIFEMKNTDSAVLVSENQSTILTSAEAEKENIRKVLLSADGNKSKASKELGISRNTLLSKIKKYGLE